MDFSSAVQSFFNKYATFEGRASRSEFWYAQLFIILTGFFLGLIEEFPKVAIQVIRELARRLQSSNLQLQSIKARRLDG